MYETMRWDTGLRLDENIVSGASYGGPIAMVRDHRRIIPQDEADTAADIFLNIYSSAGDKLAAVRKNTNILYDLNCRTERMLLCA